MCWGDIGQVSAQLMVPPSKAVALVVVSVLYQRSTSDTLMMVRRRRRHCVSSEPLDWISSMKTSMSVVSGQHR